MKASLALTIVGAAVAAAQSLADLPPCGQLCVNNMLKIGSTQLGCAYGDVKCYCSKIDFGNGVRDCSNQSCSPQDAAKVIAFGTNYCQGAGSPVSGSASGSAGTASATGSATGGAPSATGGPSSVAITTSPLVATYVSNGQTAVSTTGLVTVYSQPGASESASASSVAASASSEASNYASSVASSIAASASSVAASASGAAASATSSRAGAAPMKTAAPLLGAAGLAAVLLL